MTLTAPPSATSAAPVRAVPLRTVAGGADQLAAGYRTCAELTRRHGTTYFWGAAVLPAPQRRHVHAVYALCRLADDIVDADGATHARSVVETTAALGAFRDRFVAAVEDRGSDDPVLAAVAHTITECGIDPECFDRFFGAMAQDLTTTSYDTWDDLLGYMEGSAAVIGEMMLPVLRPTSPAAYAPARSLGLAFQLTNFLRDVDEDLDRGRVYLPRADLERYGVDPADRAVTPAWRELMRFEIARNRDLYRHADEGLAHLPGAAERCVRTARVLYAGILDRIEAADYDVFSARARVPTWRKAVTAARALAPATGSRGTSGSAGAVRVPAPVRLVPEVAVAPDPGGWYVVGASRDLGSTPLVRTVDGHRHVLRRIGPGVVTASGAGSPADRSPDAAHDDGVLLWVRIPTPGETPADLPVIAARPAPCASTAAVVEVAGTCEPSDVVAVRLASADLSCPDARTVVLTTVDGPRAGSAIETHATPLGLGADGRPRTMVVEATITAAGRRALPGGLLRPAVRRTARRRWAADLAAAERSWLLRSRGESSGD